MRQLWLSYIFPLLKAFQPMREFIKARETFPRPRTRKKIGLLLFHMIAVGFIFLPHMAFACDALPDRMKLREIVPEECLPNLRERQDPSPCVTINLDNGERNGYAILPDKNGVAQFLLIPTRKISGIEDPILLDDHLPFYWAAAWDARHFVSDKLRKALPLADIGLAVNSEPSRSQDQLHIHIDCIQPAVAATLAVHDKQIGSAWAPFPEPLMGQSYMARKVDDNDLEKDPPFRELIKLSRTPQNLGEETLVVTAVGKDLVMLETRADPASHNPGHGEDLLDADCAIAKSLP